MAEYKSHKDGFLLGISSNDSLWSQTIEVIASCCNGKMYVWLLITFA
jgi:hypothetical protein